MRYYNVELKLEYNRCIQANSEDEAYEKVINMIPHSFEIVGEKVELAEEE